MAKKSQVQFDLSVVLPTTTLSGTVALTDGVFVITHKKPRSSKFLETAIPPTAVISAQLGEEGWVSYRQSDEESLATVSGVQHDAETGLLTAETEEGAVIMVDPNLAVVSRAVEDEAPAKAVKKGVVAKKKRPAADEEDEAPARKKKILKKKRPAADEDFDDE